MSCDIKFVCNADTELARIVHACRGVGSGFYQRQRFIVEPRNTSTYPNVVIPHLPFEAIADFWSKASQLEDDVLFDDQGLVSQLKQVVSNKELDHTQSAMQVVTSLLKSSKLDQLLDAIYTLLPEHINYFKSIEFRPTQYGTRVSWSLRHKHKKVVVYLRSDAMMSDVIKALLSHLLRPPGWSERYTWRQSQAIIDHYIRRCSLHTELQVSPHQSVPQQNIPQELINQSTAYSKSIGCPLPENVFECKNNSMYLDSQCIDAALSQQESQLLQAFIEQQNQVLSYDQIGSLLWQDDDDFSLWAINKAVGRLRNKLTDEFGASLDIIQSVRGRGYLFEQKSD